MSKITLNNVVDLENQNTAISVINNNSSTIQTAFDNTLSRDGTAPNQMNNLLDMNSHPIINLPAPTSNYMPLRLIDFQTLQSGGTVVTSPLPPGGTTGQLLAKNSNANYDVTWSSTVAGGAGGAVNSIQYNNSGAFNGISLAAGQTIRGTSGAPIAGYNAWVDVTTLGVDNTGVSVTSSALQAAINTITSAGNVVYLPAGTYNMGGGTLTVPDNSTVYCHNNAVITRTADIPNVGTEAYGAYTDCMIDVGNNVRWYNGTLNNTVVTGTSTTSQTVGTGTYTFTTQSGLPFRAGNFLRVYSAFNPSVHFEGTVTSYSGTTLVMNFPFFAGSGSRSDWNINWGGVYQSPMCLHNVSNTIIDNVTTKGNWYCGILLDGWNPSTGGNLACTNNTIVNCKAIGIQNRGFYMYGICNQNEFINCYVSGTVNGFPGCTDYGFNMNPANATGTFNSQTKNRFLGCSVDGTGFQGFAVSDLAFYNIIEGCNVSNLNSTATGFLIQSANGVPVGSNQPQYNTITGCIANNCQGSGFTTIASLYTQIIGCKAVVCGTGFNILPNGSYLTSYTSCNGCQALSNTTGFNVTGVRCDLIGITAIANTTGVLINSGSSITIANGRSYANTTNISDSGTSSQISLVTA